MIFAAKIIRKDNRYFYVTDADGSEYYVIRDDYKDWFDVGSKLYIVVDEFKEGHIRAYRVETEGNVVYTVDVCYYFEGGVLVRDSSKQRSYYLPMYKLREKGLETCTVGDEIVLNFKDGKTNLVGYAIWNDRSRR